VQREERLLPALQESVPFAVPHPRWVGEFEGRRYMGYERVPGHAYVSGDDAPSIGAAIRALHAFPAGTAAHLLDADPTIAGWLDSYKELRATSDACVAPLLDSDVADALDVAFDRFFADDWDAVTPVLVHRDLGAEHLLMDRTTRALIGMIDFGDATVGDAAIDFVGVDLTGGSAATRAAINAYLDPVSQARVRFYEQLGPVHAVVYGQEIGDEQLIVDAIANLRTRLLGQTC